MLLFAKTGCCINYALRFVIKSDFLKTDANNCVEQRTKLETIKQSKAFDSSFDDDQFVLHSNLHLLNQQEVFFTVS